MKDLLHITVLGLSLAASTLAAAETETGLASLSIQDARTDRPLEGFVWYPTAQTEGAEERHGNPVWQGITAVADGVPIKEARPLVVVSHGMYGNAMNQSWFADAMVDAGYIVAAVHHPGTSTWMREPGHARQMWDRPGDVSRLIDHMLSDPAFEGRVDADRIYMAGHSLGGFTAMLLAGARFDGAGFAEKCAAGVDPLVCGIFDRWDVAETPEDVAQMERDLSDPRIKGFAVFDLGGTQSLAPESVAAIDRPMLVFGAPRDLSGLDLEIESRALVQMLPAASTRYVEPESLSHFDFLGVCKPAALELLAEEDPGDVVVCQEGGAARRVDQALVLNAVIAHFGADADVLQN